MKNIFTLILIALGSLLVSFTNKGAEMDSVVVALAEMDLVVVDLVGTGTAAVVAVIVVVTTTRTSNHSSRYFPRQRLNRITRPIWVKSR